MTIYKDVNGHEFTYNEYWNKIYLDEKRPHVDHLIRHKWPEVYRKAYSKTSRTFTDLVMLMREDIEGVKNDSSISETTDR